MDNSSNSQTRIRRELLKTPSGVRGLDEILEGGLPKGRPTLLSGSAGSGKTLLSMNFLVNGINNYEENGTLITFGESREELYDNVASLGFDMDQLEEKNRFCTKHIKLQQQNLVEIGDDYDLGGLLCQIGEAIDRVNAKRVVIDEIETLFSYFSSESAIRREIKNLFQWLKEMGVTAIVTCERDASNDRLTRHGIEEYLSDCVIILDQRIDEQVSTRRLRVVKFRGSEHGTNEYPFLITDGGISVLPITSMSLQHEAPSERISTGIETLDRIFGGEGIFRGSSILISGSAGTGKTSFSAHMARSICERGEKCIYFAFEESHQQIIRNMASIGVYLQPFIDNNLLRIHATRPTLQGLELHLLSMHRAIDTFSPSAVIIDPISNLETIGNPRDIKLMYMRIHDYMKSEKITTLSTALTIEGVSPTGTEVGISSAMDTWIMLHHKEEKSRRERSLCIMKSRGLRHSRQVHGFNMRDNGIEIDHAFA